VRALVQRVAKASVTVDGAVVGRIGQGLAVLVGVGKDDAEADASLLARKLVELRIFADDASKFNRSLKDVGGELLLVSQFTLYADTRKGRRPSFTDAAPPDQANALFERLVALLRQDGRKVETGVFGAHMVVELHNDGPVTVMLDTKG